MKIRFSLYSDSCKTIIIEYKDVVLAPESVWTFRRKINLLLLPDIATLFVDNTIYRT